MSVRLAMVKKKVNVTWEMETFQLICGAVINLNKPNRMFDSKIIRKCCESNIRFYRDIEEGYHLFFNQPLLCQLKF